MGESMAFSQKPISIDLVLFSLICFVNKKKGKDRSVRFGFVSNEIDCCCLK